MRVVLVLLAAGAMDLRSREANAPEDPASRDAAPRRDPGAAVERRRSASDAERVEKSASSAQELERLASAHPGLSSRGAEREETAARLGLVMKDGIAGTPEGHAIADMNYWISWGDFDLACVAYRVEHRSLGSAAVKFVHAWALLKLAVERKHGFVRAIAALEEVSAGAPEFKDPVAALVESVRAVAPCVPCRGAGELRCTACRGIGVVGSPCRACQGRGRIPGGGGSEVGCGRCGSRGIDAPAGCGACVNGFHDCPACEAPRAAPLLKDIVETAACEPCEGRGLVFRNVRWTCGRCRGIGLTLVPKVRGKEKGGNR